MLMDEPGDVWQLPGASRSFWKLSAFFLLSFASGNRGNGGQGMAGMAVVQGKAWSARAIIAASS